MEKQINVNEILKGMKSDPFVLNCGMPMGYVPGLPILQIRNEELCLVIPFLRYRVTGQVDKTLVYPIRYTMTMVLPEKSFVEFQNLAYQPRFQKVEFNEPVGLFRHEAIRTLSKQQYQSTREELLSQYDKVIRALLCDEEYCAADELRMQQLLQMLVEPSLLPIYQALDMDFYNKYLQ